MRRILTPLAALAVLSFVGGAVAQDAVQTDPSTGNAGNVEMLSCADLNEMEPEAATSFLRGYHYGLTAAGRAGVPGASPVTAGSGNAAQVGAGQASTPAAGEAAGAGTTAEGTPFDSEAILASCFDAPSTPLDEILSGAFGAAN